MDKKEYDNDFYLMNKILTINFKIDMEYIEHIAYIPKIVKYTILNAFDDKWRK